MPVNTRKPRHRSQKHKKLTTAQAILAVAEEMCAVSGVGNLKLADIANELGIEPPSIYRHYNGIKGVIAALGEVALKAEIDTFAGIEKLPFADALKLQAERCFDLYFERPGLTRFSMIDLAIPGGVHVFADSENLDLIRELFRLENGLLQRGIEVNAVRPMSVITFIAARMGPAIIAFAMKDMQSAGSRVGDKVLKEEYVAQAMSLLDPVR